MARGSTIEKPPALPPPAMLTPEQITSLKEGTLKGATESEVQSFVSACQRTRLDPFMKQIYGILRKDSNLGRKVLCIQIGIDGARLIAERTGKRDGQEGPFWCGSDGVWKDVWLDKQPPSAAKVAIYRLGSVHPFTGIAHWSEYALDTNFWRKSPASQLAKCAEALALRMAHPHELGGLYTTEEMGDEPVNVQVLSSTPEPQAPATPVSAAAATAPAINGSHQINGQTPAALAAPKVTDEQLASIKALKDAIGIDGETWKKVVGKRGVTSAKDLSYSQAEELIGNLRAKAPVETTKVGGVRVLPDGSFPDKEVPF
jgi:phage recombination protein Bet